MKSRRQIRGSSLILICVTSHGEGHSPRRLVVARPWRAAQWLQLCPPQCPLLWQRRRKQSFDALAKFRRRDFGSLTDADAIHFPPPALLTAREGMRNEVTVNTKS